MDAASSAVDRPGERLLAALLATAEQRQVSAFVGMHEARLGVVVLPDLGAGVAILDRGSDDAATLKTRIDAILAGHARGILHLVLVGSRDRAADAAVLIEADRGAHDPNRLGVHLLDGGRIVRVAGRRMGLIGEAAARLAQHRPLEESEIVSHNTETQKHREEAAAFAAALDHRPQRAIRLLGVANILLFALEVVWGGRGASRLDPVTLLNMGANSALKVWDGELWRVLSHAFLHGDAIHLIVNLIALFSFGGLLEGLMGWRRMVLLYGLSALAGGVASAFIGDASLSVGASGAVWGFMAAGAAITLRRDRILPPLIAGRLRPRLLAVLGVNLAFSLWGYLAPGPVRIDLWAHAGGGAAGFLLAFSGLLTRGLVPGSPPQGKAANPLWLKLSTAVVLILLAGSVATAFVTGQPWRDKVVLAPDEMA